MRLTEEEKKILDINANDSYIEKQIQLEEAFKTYYWKGEDNTEKFKIIYNYFKKLIMIYSDVCDFNIDENAMFDIDEILKNNFPINDELPSFNPLLYKDKEKLKNYYAELSKEPDWVELYSKVAQLKSISDGFREYMSDNIANIIDIFDRLSETFDGDVISSNSDVICLNELPSKEKILNCIKVINTAVKLKEYQDINSTYLMEMNDVINQKKLDYYYSDEEFSKKLDVIMSHDTKKSTYYFHGTQCLEDAQSILIEGLGMTREQISSTAYSELSKDELLLYSRGMGGEIGSSAIVIIDSPKDENGKRMNIVRVRDQNEPINFSPSGLQGLDGKANYIIDTKYIVGYVDKINKKIVFNPNYKDYDKYTDIANDNVTINRKGFL